MHGYQWKSLFLPSGTTLRMPYLGKNYYAKVEGDYILYEGQSVSPNEFTLAVTGGKVYSAARILWIMRPGDTVYYRFSQLK